MKSKIKCRMLRKFSGILSITLLILITPINTIEVCAVDTQDKVVVVSLGDSYSSGEGIEPFYGQFDTVGQSIDFIDKLEDEDWIAHRSTKSWPSLLEIPGVDGTMGDYWTGNAEISNSSNCEWYFAAVSGALTSNVMQYDQEQKEEYMGYQMKEYDKFQDLNNLSLDSLLIGSVYLSPQLDVFEEIDEPVDYVTLTIGGNDIGFADIIYDCALGSTLLGNSNLNDRLSAIYNEFDVTEANLKQAYLDISNAAGSQASIIVAGYPELLDYEGKGWLISQEEAEKVNKLVNYFNDRVEAIVNDLRAEGMSIYFVDVEQEFEGHQAYSDDAWINEIILEPQSEDLSDKTGSAYSMHPNAYGAVAYAECVNDMIEEIEEEKNEVEETMLTNETICGLWIVDATKTYEESGKSLQDVFGTSVKLSSGSIEIGEDGSFKFAIGYDGGEGTYTWGNNIISYEIELYNSGEPTGTVTLEDSVEGQTYMILNYDIGTETPYKLYFTKEEQLDITAISTEQLVGEWYIDDYTTYYSSGYTLKEIYGNDIEYNGKAVRMYQDKTYEYDVDSYGNIEYGTYIIDGDRVVFNCENTNGDVELTEMTMVEDWNQLKLIKLHNGSEVRYFKTSNELAETTVQEASSGAYAFDTIDNVIDHVLKDCNAWREDDGLYVILDNEIDIKTTEDGSVTLIVRYQRSEEELQEFAQAFADSGITSDGTGYTYCMDVEVETANGKYYLKYDDGSYYQGE